MARFLASSRALLLVMGIAFTGAGAGPAWAADAADDPRPDLTVVLNPYEGVDWDTMEHHPAALHVHTLQSDGYHMLDEVVRAYQEAGFTILAVTDHDNMEPNARIRWGDLDEGEGTHLPEKPKPESYPANTTWPWTDFEAPAPEELGMLGVEAAELTHRHHMHSFFNDYGAPSGDVTEDEQLREVGRRGGLAILDHPGIDADWWTRRPVEWYARRFAEHPPEYLVGMEVTNAPPEREAYDERLWDQLLARFMPERPIWGFGTDDMHNLAGVRESDSVFLLDELSEREAREAMRAGRFYFRKSTRRIDLREGRGVFPRIERIEVDHDAGTITVEASEYDRVRWITAPESLDPIADHETSNEPWPAGRVIHDEPTLNYREAPGIERYVRLELERTEDGHTYRTFTNPFGLGREER